MNNDGVARTPREREFEALCRAMLDEGTKPTPARLYPAFSNGRNIRGNYVRIRNRLLQQYGYFKHPLTDLWTRREPRG